MAAISWRDQLPVRYTATVFNSPSSAVAATIWKFLASDPRTLLIESSSVSQKQPKVVATTVSAGPRTSLRLLRLFAILPWSLTGTANPFALLPCVGPSLQSRWQLPLNKVEHSQPVSTVRSWTHIRCCIRGTVNPIKSAKTVADNGLQGLSSNSPTELTRVVVVPYILLEWKKHNGMNNDMGNIF